MTAKIALLLPKFTTYGGVEGFGFRLAKALANEGYRVDFICARQEAPSPEGVHVHTVGRPPLIRAAKIAWFACAAEQARKKGNYDLTIGLGKTFAQDILRMSGGPLSLFWQLSKRAYTPPMRQKIKMFLRKTAPSSAAMAYLEHASLKNQKVCVAVSHRVKDWLVSAYPWLLEKDLRVIYNRPDLERFNPVDETTRKHLRKKFPVDRNKKLILWVGTSFVRKGFSPLLQAMTLLPRDIQLVAAGGRNPRSYQRMAKHLGIEERVHFLGRVNDMPALYQTADVFCMPTFFDTCANATLEALACSTPAISTTDDGSSFFLPKSSVLTHPADYETMAKVIENALNAPRPQAFIWPEDIPCGLRPYVQLIKEFLG